MLFYDPSGSVTEDLVLVLQGDIQGSRLGAVGRCFTEVFAGPPCYHSICVGPAVVECSGHDMVLLGDVKVSV